MCGGIHKVIFQPSFGHARRDPLQQQQTQRFHLNPEPPDQEAAQDRADIVA